MEEQKDGLSAEESQASDESGDTPVDETTEQQPEADEQETQEPQSPASGVDDEVDERGVPLKNVAMEYRRKYEELTTQLPDLIQDAVSKAIPKQPGQQQYSKEDLIRFKNDPDTTPQHRAWAEIELDKARSEETMKLLTSQQEKVRRELKHQNDLRQADQELRNRYSVMFNSDGSFNGNHPLSKQFLQVYNSHPAYKNEAMGVLNAADAAFGQYALKQQPNLAKATAKLKQKVKQLEKATLAEGSGQPVTPDTKNAMDIARERLSRNGADKDALKAYAHAYLKSQGKFD